MTLSSIFSGAFLSMATALHPAQTVPFDSGRWHWNAAEHRVEEHLGRKSLYLKGGIATVSDARFTNGAIEFDVAFTRERGFMGGIWRVQDDSNYEEFYLRPHQSGNPDANQYTPVFNGVAGWQLYHGKRYSVPVEYRFEEWIHVKILFGGSQAELYIGDMEKPVLYVDGLKRSVEPGGVGLRVLDFAPAHFSNFSFTVMDSPPFQGRPGTPESLPENAVSSWSVSDAFRESDLVDRTAVDPDHLAARSWTRLETESSGLANLARVQGVHQRKDTVYVRKVVHSSREQVKRLDFGFSNRVRVYLNGRLLFRGNDPFRSRDYRFLGSIGYFDSLYLPLREGDNELLMAVSEEIEDLGGWGVQARFESLAGIVLKDEIAESFPKKGGIMLENELDKPPELSRRGVILTYPMFRYWHKQGLEEGLKPQPLNVYIHMPYCIQRCAYCYFKTTTLKENRLQEIDRYVSSVAREMALGSKRFHLQDRPVKTVYFGGGTPTLMSEENIDKLFASLHESFTLADPQITFEGEPVTLTERKADILARHKVNRISLGIQSFKEEIVRNTGRSDTEEQTVRAIELAKKTGADVNIDLISGLAGETPETWAYSVRRALEVDVPSITIYKLELYANTPYYNAEKHEQIALPTDEEELELIKYALGELRKRDYRPVNAFTFTKGGKHDQLNTRNRWLGQDSYAVGVSSYGSLGRWNYQNTSDIKAYTEIVENGELPVFRGYTCTSFDMAVRDAVMAIKLIDLDHVWFREKHGHDLLKVCETELAQLEADGFVTVDSRNISLTELGVLYGDHVSRTFEASLKKFGGTGSGSRARVHF